MAEKNGGYLKNSYLLSAVGIIALTIGSIVYLAIQDYLYFVEENEHSIIDQSQRITLVTDKYFEKYRDIFTAIAHSDCVVKRDGAACSRFFARLNGLYPMVENFAAIDRDGRFFASGQPFDRNNPPNVRDLPFFRALESGASSYVMNPHTGPISGARVTGIVIPLLDGAGKFDGLIGVSLKMEEIETLWEGMLNQPNAIYLIIDRNQRLIAASDHAEQLLGQRKISLDLLTKTMQQNGSGRKFEISREFTLHAISSEPSEWMIISLIPTRLPIADYLKDRTFNKVAGTFLILLLGLTIFGLFRDALSRTRLKQTEKKLQASYRELEALAALDRSEQRYQELFQNAPVGLWEEDFTAAIGHIEQLRQTGIKDLNDYFNRHPDELREIAAKVVILDINKTSLMMLKAESKAQLLGSLDKIFKASSYAIFQQEIIALADGKAYIELQSEVVTLKDETRTMIIRAFRLGKRDEYDRILIAISDITQLKLTEEALRRSQKMDAIGQITGGIAHDFNNILGIIIGNLDLLKLQFNGDEKSLKRVTTALQAALRAADLTRQLLGFSRQQAQESEPTDLNETIREMQNLITRSVTPAIEVSYRQSEALWPVRISPGDFKDALLNLILNAKDAMPNGGQLTIQTVNRSHNDAAADNTPEPFPGDYVVLRVRDTGCGIPADVIDHIFEPFYTTKPQGKGTGLGLSMVFGFVKRSNGEVNVASKPGQGTTVSLFLPRADALAKKAQPAAIAEDRPLQAHATILVVDDEQALLELATSYLEGWGYSVISAGSGQEALQRLGENPAVDLLFTDILMPGGMSGYELAEAATRINPRLKVLFTSGFAKEADRKQARFPGSQTLSKPYTTAELSHKLRQLLND